MAAELFLLPFRPALDMNAVPVVGATLYFYATGTSTPQAVFADADLTVSLGSQVQANAAGVWPVIYLDGTKVYRAVLRDQDGALLDETDPYVPGVVDALAPEIAADAAAVIAARNEIFEDPGFLAVSADLLGPDTIGVAAANMAAILAAPGAAATATTQAGIATTQAGIATTQAGVATTQAGIATTQAGNAAASAITATATASRNLRRATEPDQNLFNKNAPGIALNTILRVSDGALITAGATGYNTSDFCNVEAGQTIIATRRIGFAGTDVYGLVWYDANNTRISGLPVGGGAPIAPFTPMVAPANAVSFRFCTQAVTSNNWGEIVILYGSTAPAAVRTFKTLDKNAGRANALDSQILRDRPKRDFTSPEDFIRGAYRNTSGGFTYDANFGTSNRIAGYPGFTVNPTVSISGNLGIAYYDIDGTYLYTGNQLLAGSITVATNPRLIVITAADGYAPAVGTPVSGTNVPAGTYVVSRTSPRTPCTVTISADATADSSGNFTFQGVLSNVPITFPEEACFAEFPMTAGSFYYAQYLSNVPARGDVFKGVRYDGFAGLPLAGQETVLEGDSIMQSSAAGSGQPVPIPPGASGTVGVMQYLLQMLTQCDVTAYRGQSGKQAYQALAAYGSVGAMSSGDFASAALTASITSGSTAFSVTVGTPVAGRRITGPGIEEQTYIVSVAGSPGAYTGVLSRPAFATRSGAYTIPYLRNYIDENITNSWGLATTDGTRAYAQVALGTLGDTWVPTLMNITFNSGSTAITINSTSIGAPANGMPVSAVGGQKVSPGTTLVDLGGGSWALSLPAIAGGSVTARGGSYYGDLYDIHIRKVATWSPQTRQILLGALRRFDSTAATSNSASPDYREGDPMNDLGVYLSDFNTAKRLFAERWGHVFIDTFNRFPVNSLSYVGRFDAAKLHPNTQFVYENYAPFLSGEINKLPPTGR